VLERYPLSIANSKSSAPHAERTEKARESWSIKLEASGHRSLFER